MFLSFLKNYFLLKFLKNNLNHSEIRKDLVAVRTVGILIDETNFSETEALIQEIIANGILENNISVLVYTDKWKKNTNYIFPTFGIKHINWNAQIKEPIAREFIKQKFDLLINYYDIEKAFLNKVSQQSRAQFKVGFADCDKKLNHLMINTNINNHLVFVHELFRYLKILNKI